MQYTLVGAPLELGCGTAGTAGAAAVLCGGEDGLEAFLMQNGQEVLSARAFAPMTVRRPDEVPPKYLPECIAACSAARDAVDTALGEGRFPLTVGGDHALGLGTVSGTGRHYSPEELSLVWVDAHTDINTEASSFSGNIHGMPIAALLGLCQKPLSSVGDRCPVLLPQNVHIFFARDIDPPEEEIIAAHGVHLYRMSEIRECGLNAVLQRLLANITTPYLHISWDVDSIGSEYFTATGLPIPHGPTPEEVTRVLTALAAGGRAVAMDCVEYNPTRDDTAQSGRRTVLEILKPTLLALSAAKE